ncbi:ketoacyl-synt-domain-containing protein [Coprinellus micaceus]|uniref:Ketoacyl-synt-domain-containing protein n=1 Tax=Coprinellus micaceus TaxID=71717 RepID=A0A4Y7SMD1_COPMI|nr:ketoacyl-synt-domain-containing protein [Coprinellus micaceus]
MSQSSGLVACGLLEADVATSRGDLQNSLSPSPSLTCRPHKSSEKALRRRNGFRDSFDDGHNTLVDDGRIAIVGMALKMPGADSLDELWQLIKSGTPASTTVPLSRFDVNAHRDEGRRAVALKANTGHFVNGLDEFDNGFFNVSPREAKMMDPQQRLLLHVAQEALDDAGFIPRSSYSSDPDHVGVFIGAATNDYVHNVRDDIDIHYAPGTLPAFLSGRISYALSLGGPSTVYDTACSSSATALHAAVRALRNGDCRMALAGGVNAITSPDLFMGLDVAGFLSRTGQSKPFDAEADGYSRGEGCGLFVLKCLSDALLDDDRILGIIRGIEANQSYANSSITRTHSPTQAALLRRLLEKSRLRPGDIDIVEAHAAGTRQGDTSELLAIQDVFLQQQFVEGRQAPLFLSSIKATIGHLEAASGAASLAKVLLMLQHQTIPRQVGVQKLNSVMNTIPPSQMTIPMETAPWLGKEDGQPRRAIINNYGAAGSNVSIIVEEYVEGAQSTVDTKANSTTVLGLSAKSEQALLDMKEHYIACLNSLQHDASLLDFCYTATARRQLHKYRLSVASPNSKDKLLKCLDEASIVQAHQGTVEVVLVYPGYGSQYPGMGRVLYESCQAFRDCVNECSAIVLGHGLPKILPYLLNGDSPAVEESGIVEQTALFSFEVALSKVWITWGVSPAAVIGYSLGEYAALVISGVLSLEDALLMVGRRAQLVEKRWRP